MLLYSNEPPRFSRNNLQDFVIWAMDNETSDIHIQNEDKIICEIHGKKHRVTNRKLSRQELVDIIIGMHSDGAISKLHADGYMDFSWSIQINRNKILRARVNITVMMVEGHKGYQITMRLIKNDPLDIKFLNLPEDVLNNICHKRGLVLIVGQTGSGKSTFLASVIAWRLQQLNSHLKIITIEDPIEYIYDNIEKPSSFISQTEIGTHLASFNIGARNAFRRRADVVLIGEMREPETIREGLKLAMAGQLVYSTLHSNGVAEVPSRMALEFDKQEKDARITEILDNLKIIIAQILVPSTDGKRVAIREYLIMNEDIVEQVLLAGVDKMNNTMKKMLKKYGHTFLQDAKEKLAQGLITEEVFKDLKLT